MSHDSQEDVEQHVVETENIGSTIIIDEGSDKDEAVKEENTSVSSSSTSSAPIFTPNEILEMKEEGAEMAYYEENAAVLVDDYEEVEEEVATAHDVEHDGYEAVDDLLEHPDIGVELMRRVELMNVLYDYGDPDKFDTDTSTAEEDYDEDDQDLPCM